MNIAVYCGSSQLALDELRHVAHEFGTWIAKSGNSLVYGGSAVGLMGEVSAATLEAGGKAYGVETRFFIEAGVAQHDLTELFVVETMSERKAKMIELSDVFVALPGGVGTLEEISEIMCRVRLKMNSAPCYFLNLNGYYNGMIAQLEQMVKAQFIEQGEVDALYAFPSTIDELIEMLEDREIIEDGIDSGALPVVPESNLIMGL